MLKRIFIAVIALSLISVLGCWKASPTPTVSPTPVAAQFEPLKTVDIASKWKVKELRVEVGADKEFLLLLKLAEGDKVDGYFYLEKGANAGFQIAGKTLVYKYAPDIAKAGGGVPGDPFSFTATREQGDMYMLTLDNHAARGGSQSLTVFLHIIYPANALVFVPIEVA